MSKAELSRRTGAANSTITRWEEETNLPPLHQIMKVGEILDYSLAWFLQDLDAEIRTGTNLSEKIFPTEETDRAEKAVRLKDLVQAAPSVQILVSVADDPQRR
jgi:Helix-turn-helix.